MADNLQSLLDQIDALKAEIDVLPPISERSKDELWRKYRMEWNYNSNHIEGNTLTYGETELLLIFDKVTGDHTTREIDEMRGHDVAIKLVSEWAQEKDRLINQADIRNLNEIILVKPFFTDAITSSGQKTRKRIVPGKYKVLPNHVKLQNGETFYYAEPDEVEPKMQELLRNYAESIKEIHPVVLAAKIHYEFVLIHPFDDGNGRVSRLLMNYHLLRNTLAPIIIKSDDKKNYLLALNKADIGDFNSFVEYIAQQEIWSLELMLKATKGESVEEIEDWKKKLKIINQTTRSINDTTPIRSSEIIYKRYIDSFQPLNQALVNSLELFRDRVFEIYHEFNLKTKETDSINSYSSIRLAETDESVILKILNDLNTDGFVMIFYVGMLTKESQNEVSFNFPLIIHLEKFQYVIDFPSQNFKERKNYSEKLDDTEIQSINNLFGNWIYDKLELP